MSDSLADRLKALGVRIGARDLAVVRTDAHPIESVVEGAWIKTPRGPAFLADRHFAPDARHGATPLAPSTLPDVLAAWARDDRLRDLPPESFVFLDAETSGLSGGTGTYAFLLGVGRFEADGFHLAQFFMRDPAGEPALLEALADFLAPARALVTFNGKAFDAPLLRNRYILHAAPVPFEGFSHLDLLPLARRLWRDRLPSRALKYLEEHILGAPRTAEEVPGYEIPYLYFDYLRDGDARRLKGVFYHNAMDVAAMAALLGHVAGLLSDPLTAPVEHGLDLVAMARLFEELGRWETAARIYERGLQSGLEEADFWPTVQRLSLLQRRRGALEDAVRWWTQAAQEGHVYAWVELAKHHEHRLKDPARALDHTLQAMRLVQSQALPDHMRRAWLSELEHRARRLRLKLGVADEPAA